MREHASDPGKRWAQHLLATEVLTLVHGSDVAARTREEHSAMRNPNVVSIPGSDSNTITLPSSNVIGQTWAKVLREAGLAPSNSAATRLIAGGGVSVASQPAGRDGSVVFEPLVDTKAEVTENMLLGGKLLVRLGKWRVKVIEVMNDTHALQLVFEEVK